MALIGRVRAYKVDKDDPPDPAKQDDMPDPEFDLQLYGMSHEINVPIRPEDVAPVPAARSGARRDGAHSTKGQAGERAKHCRVMCAVLCFLML